MHFDDLDRSLRVFETAHDRAVLPEIYMVARIDGRGFTKLTKETIDFEKPFDVRFRDLMISTTRHLMDCGFGIVYGYTQSDEISLLFDLNDRTFGRKTRKIMSVLAGEASAHFSVGLGHAAAFDCRISELPNTRLVVDYFRWRHEDARRIAKNAHSYWLLRSEGKTARQATQAIEGLSIAAKNELLFQHGINVNDLPNWQKRGSGTYWETYSRTGTNKQTGETTETQRRQLVTNMELPLRDDYSAFLTQFLTRETP